MVSQLTVRKILENAVVVEKIMAAIPVHFSAPERCINLMTMN